MFHKKLITVAVALSMSAPAFAMQPAPVYFECVPTGTAPYSTITGTSGISGMFGMNCQHVPNALILKLPDPAVLAAQKKEEESIAAEEKRVNDIHIAKMAEEARIEREALAAEVKAKEELAAKAMKEAEDAKRAMELAQARVKEAEAALTKNVESDQDQPIITPAVAFKDEVKSASVATRNGAAKASGKVYGPTKNGENVSAIAQTVYPQKGLKMDEIVRDFVALNPKAFKDGKASGLKSGSVLKIPSIEGLMPKVASKAESKAKPIKQEPAQKTSDPIEKPDVANVIETKVQHAVDPAQNRVIALPAPKAETKPEANTAPAAEAVKTETAPSAQIAPSAPTETAVLEKPKPTPDAAPTEAKKALQSEIDEIRKQMLELNAKLH